jgi:hypothetical protein
MLFACTVAKSWFHIAATAAAEISDWLSQKINWKFSKIGKKYKINYINIIMYIYFNPWFFFWGGKAWNFWDIFYLTTWNIPPQRIFLGF